jgi:hypothetical protein
MTGAVVATAVVGVLLAIAALAVAAADGDALAAVEAAVLLVVVLLVCGSIALQVGRERRAEARARRAPAVIDAGVSRVRDEQVVKAQADRTVAELSGRISQSEQRAAHSIARSNDALYRQIECREVLQDLLGAGVLPPMRSFAVSPDLALDLARRVLDGRAATIVETGSGVSTLVIALALQRRASGGHGWALEHDASYAERTRALLEHYGCGEFVTVVHAPLVPVTVDGASYPFYDVERLPVSGIDLLFIDGPPATSNPRARFPALHVFRPLLDPSAVIVLDDADRPDERGIVEEWVGAGLCEVVARPRHEKGTVELALHAGPAPGLDVQPDDAPVTTSWVDPSEFDNTLWRERYGVRASYMYKLHESKRRRALLRHFGHRQRIWAHNSKRDGYALAESLGIGIPEQYVASTKLSAVDWAGLPERFVIKPRDGAANRGVYGLIAQGDGSYLDALDGKVKRQSDVVEEYQRLVADRLVNERCAIEELLAPTPDLAEDILIPDDLKIWCFYDEPVVVMQRRMHGSANRKRWTFKFWDVGWNDLGPVKYEDRLDRSLAAPVGGDAVLEACRVIGRELAVPFVRLDLYDTVRGPVFGEVSVHPGPPEVWRDDIDELMGKHWEIAEARLLAEGRSISEPLPAPRPSR